MRKRNSLSEEEWDRILVESRAELLAMKQNPWLQLSKEVALGLMSSEPSLFSCAQIQLSRLLHYMLFSVDGSKPPLLTGGLSDMAKERFDALVTVASAAQSAYDSGDPPKRAEELVASSFPGIQFDALARLCHFAARYHWSESVLKRVEEADDDFSFDVETPGRFMHYRHGRGYSHFDIGLFRRTDWIFDPHAIKTEINNRAIAELLKPIVMGIYAGAFTHPMSFATLAKQLVKVTDLVHDEQQRTMEWQAAGVRRPRVEISATIEKQIRALYRSWAVRSPNAPRFTMRQIAFEFGYDADSLGKAAVESDAKAIKRRGWLSFSKSLKPDVAAEALRNFTNIELSDIRDTAARLENRPGVRPKKNVGKVHR